MIDELGLLRMGYRLVRGQPVRITDQGLPEAPPEATFLADVGALAHAAGFAVACVPATHSRPPGCPQPVLARPASQSNPGRLVFATLVAARAKPTQAQATWQSLLRHGHRKRHWRVPYTSQHL